MANPIKQIKLTDLVVERLQKEIASGKYKEGQKIPTEPELMKQLGVGRSTVREAVKTLANSGVLQVQQGSGTYVNNNPGMSEPLDQRLRRADMDEVNDVRSFLEMEIVKRAILQHNTNDLMQMKSHLAKRAKAIIAGNYEECLTADVAFHLSVAMATHNEVLADLYKSFSNAMQRFFRERDKNDINMFSNTQQLHEQLYVAISKKNEILAVATVQLLLSNNH